MAFVLADRVQENTATTGTGTLTLGGATTQMQSFATGVGNGNSTAYCLLDGNGIAWETGYGTVGGGGTTLSRDTIISSTNSNTAITLSANIHTVFCTAPAFNISPRLATLVTPVGNGNDTSEDLLMTYTMPANTLIANGQAVRITSSGIFAANTHSKNLRLYFGSQNPGSVTASASTTTQWIIEAIVYRTGATTQSSHTALTCYSNAFVLVAASSLAAVATNLTQTLSSNLDIKVTGQVTGTTAANDIVANTMMVEYLP